MVIPFIPHATHRFLHMYIQGAALIQCLLDFPHVAVALFLMDE